MVFVFKLVFFLVILLFALASTGDSESSSDSESSTESEIGSDVENYEYTDAVADIPKKAVLGEVIQDPFCGGADLGQNVVLAPGDIWEMIIIDALDCSEFQTKIRCLPSQVGGCKTVDSISVIIVGPTIVLQEGISLIFTVARIPFFEIAVEGATEIMIELVE